MKKFIFMKLILIYGANFLFIYYLFLFIYLYKFLLLFLNILLKK